MSFNLGQEWIEMQCPNCTYSIEVQLIDFRLQSTIFCNNCKYSIALVDSEASVHTSVAAIDQTHKDLLNIFKNFK